MHLGYAPGRTGPQGYAPGICTSAPRMVLAAVSRQALRPQWFQHLQLYAGKECAHSGFSTCSCMLANAGPTVLSAAVGHQALLSQWFQHLQLYGGKHCAHNGFSSCRPPCNAPTMVSALAPAGKQCAHNGISTCNCMLPSNVPTMASAAVGCQTLRSHWFQHLQL